MSVRGLKSLEQSLRDPLHKKYCMFILGSIEATFIDGNAPIVRDALASNWDKVGRFVTDVKEGRDVSAAIGRPSREFLPYAKNMLDVFGFFPRGPVVNQQNARYASPDPRPVSSMPTLPAVTPVTRVVMPVVLLFIVVYLMMYALHAGGSTRDQQVEKDGLIADLVRNQTALTGLISELKGELYELKTYVHDDAGRDASFQAGLQKHIEKELTKTRDELKDQVNLSLKSQNDQVTRLNRALGDQTVAVNTLSSKAKGASETCATTTNTLKETQEQIKPVQQKLEDVETRVHNVRLAVNEVEQVQADSFNVYLGFFGVTLVVCVATAFYMYVSVVYVDQVKGEIFVLAPSHRQLSDRVKEIEKLVGQNKTAAKAPTHGISAAPDGPGS